MITKNQTYEAAKADVHRRWGDQVEDLVGKEIWEALVGHNILITACAQDDDVSDAAFRRVVTKAREAQLEDLYG